MALSLAPPATPMAGRLEHTWCFILQTLHYLHSFVCVNLLAVVFLLVSYSAFLATDVTSKEQKAQGHYYNGTLSEVIDSLLMSQIYSSVLKAIIVVPIITVVCADKRVSVCNYCTIS